jgi:HEAT repeat protein
MISTKRIVARDLRIAFVLFQILLALCVLPMRQPSLADHTSSYRSSQPVYAGLTRPDPAERGQAVQAVRAARDRLAVPALLEHLADPDQMVGLYIAQALGELATADALDELRAALRDPDPNVRWRAALALGERRDVNAVIVLSRALRDPEVLVQSSAAEALARIGTPEAAASLVAALTSAQDSVVHNAMSGLQTIGEAAVAALVEVLGSNNPSLRKNAATTLGYIASPQALPALQAALADPDDGVRAEVAWAIGQIQQRIQQKR